MAVNNAAKVSQRLGRISARTGKPLKEENSKVTNIFHAAERSAEFFDHLKAHYRESRRTSVEIKAEIKLVLPDGNVFDAGKAVIRNISPSGALLGDVKLPKNCYPVSPFKVEIVMKGGDHDGIGIEALPVRFEHAIGGMGVKFNEIFVAA